MRKEKLQMKISIVNLKKNKGNVEISESEIKNSTPGISQTDIEMLVSNAISLVIDNGGNNEQFD